MKSYSILNTIGYCALLPLLIFQSCTSSFELGDVTAEEKLVLYCFPTADSDTTIIQLSKSIPVSEKGTPERGIPGAQILFTVNGEPKAVHWNESGTPGVPDLCYYVVTPLNSGDRIDIEASLNNLTASSQTIVPGQFQLDDMSLGIKPGIEKELLFKISFTDPGNSEDYYGIRVVQKSVIEHGKRQADGQWEKQMQIMTSTLAFDLTDEPLINNKVGLDATFDLDYDFYQGMYIWNDETIGGKSYTLHLTAPYLADIDVSDENMFQKVTIYYHVYLYRLSSDLYLFLKSLNDTKNNVLGQNGLAPIRSNYTNIINGFGVVGGCQLTIPEPLRNP